ncbi:hypothetical protein PRK78_006232 [Emydomyces testavorans]|uniref:Uncharacterized protein n=1 Tax=Emydomyces testavorans TaxID=2070801 RepID=A0AAF0IKA4_9EURO|nr:hypothetical protein PRK78_006232 [Emydomyces testavorans]
MACKTSTEERNSPVRWRSLAPIKAPSFKSSREGASFLTMGSIERYSGESVNLDADEEILSEFYDHSFALHEGMHPSSMSNDTKSFTDDSETTPSFGDESQDGSVSKLPQSPFNVDGRYRAQGHLIDIEDIPRAGYLQSIAPQTVTVNLIVAVISIRPRRRVRTRWGREMDIVELLVGDETKSGFRVSCWVPPSKEGSIGVAPNSLEESLKVLRLRDVILLRSVALSSFRGQVYGQSLRQNMTRLDILNREAVSSADVDVAAAFGGPGEDVNRSHPQAIKVLRVRRWIQNFVAPGPAGNENANRPLLTIPAEEAIELPPDTP